MEKDINMENEALDNIVVLNNENGEEAEFEFLDLIEYKGEEYVVLLPIEEDDGMVVILKVESSENEEVETYVSVENDEILNAVFEIFKEKFKEEFNFTDE